MEKLAGRRACPVVFQQRGASGNVVALSLHVCDVVDLNAHYTHACYSADEALKRRLHLITFRGARSLARNDVAAGEGAVAPEGLLVPMEEGNNEVLERIWALR